MRPSDKEALIHECLVQNYEKYYRMAYRDRKTRLRMWIFSGRWISWMKRNEAS